MGVSLLRSASIRSDVPIRFPLGKLPRNLEQLATIQLGMMWQCPGGKNRDEECTRVEVPCVGCGSGRYQKNPSAGNLWGGGLVRSLTEGAEAGLEGIPCSVMVPAMIIQSTPMLSCVGGLSSVSRQWSRRGVSRKGCSRGCPGGFLPDRLCPPLSGRGRCLSRFVVSRLICPDGCWMARSKVPIRFPLEKLSPLLGTAK